jgi:hypothetical protein
MLLPQCGEQQAGHALYPSGNTRLWSQDTSKYLLICTDCRDTDTAADVSYRIARTVTPSGAPSQSPIVLYKKQDVTACIYIKLVPSLNLVARCRREKGEL